MDALNVSVVRKLPTSRSLTPGSQANLPSPHHAMTDESADASLFSGETVSSKMLMMGFSTALPRVQPPHRSPW